MIKIRVLSPEIISKIAAGEVIERPASVVKELLENSLDAGADTVQIDLEKSGRNLIRIRDNGSGIPEEDLKSVFIRHATSKLAALEDLNTITSLGFRGEALYSIAAIADVTLRSKTADGQTGWEIHARGGEIVSLKPVPFTQGTEVRVKELFFNTPARRKFLKSDTTELTRIISLVTPYTLLHPQRRFEVTHNAKSLIRLSPGTSRTERAAKSLKLDPRHLLETSCRIDGLNLSFSLILGDINIQRARRDLQYICINERPVHNRAISFHMNEAFRCLMPKGISPFFCVCIVLPPSDVDVNVHPSKREVKFRNESTIASALRRLTEEALMQYSGAKQTAERIFILPRRQDESIPLSAQPPHDIKSARSMPLDEQEHRLLFDNASSIPLQKTGHSLRHTLSNALFIGSFRNKYLLFDARDSILFMDQHAAHERINYEKLKSQIGKAGIEIDNLLTPILLKVNSGEMLIWEGLKSQLENLGFSTTSWDSETVALHAYPRLIRNPEHALRLLLSDEDTVRADTDTLARRACRQSVMTGDFLSKEEALNVRKELLACEDPFTCPHGRPTVIEIKETHISKQFLR